MKTPAYFKSLYPFKNHENLIIYDFSFKERRLWKYNIQSTVLEEK